MNLDQRFIPDIYSGILELAVPLFILVIAISLIGLILLKLIVGGAVSKYIPFLFAFSLLGGVPGVIAGSSQEPIVGAMLTGLLGVVASLLTYLFSKDSLDEWRPVIPFSIIFMVICALGGLTIGGVRKAKFDNFDREYAVYKSELENLYFPVEKEKRLMKLRRIYGEEARSADSASR